jgi:glycoprotein 2-beta-D-xylosyltransferase
MMFPASSPRRRDPFSSAGSSNNRFLAILLNCDVKQCLCFSFLLLLIANIMLLTLLQSDTHNATGGPQHHLISELNIPGEDNFLAISNGRTTTAETSWQFKPDLFIKPGEFPHYSVSFREKYEIMSKPGTNSCENCFGNGYHRQISFCSEQIASLSSYKCHTNSAIVGAVCELRNISITPNLVRVAYGGEAISAVIGRAEDDEYPQYSPGAFKLSCSGQSRSQISQEEEQIDLPVHMPRLHSSIEYVEGPALESECAGRWIEDRAAMIVTRFEYANLYHTMTDFYNAFQAEAMFNLHSDPKNPEITKENQRYDLIFFDGHSASNLDETWARLLPSANIIYLKHLELQLKTQYNSTRLCYRRLIQSSPAYQSGLAPNQMNEEYERCDVQNTPQFKLFVQHFIESFGFSENSLPAAQSKPLVDILRREIVLQTSESKPVVLFILRRPYLAHPRIIMNNHERRIINEEEVVAKLGAAVEQLGGTLLALDFALLSMKEQLFAVRSADIIIGMHGAALSHILFARAGTNLIELTSAEYFGRFHFRFFALWAARKYEIVEVVSRDQYNFIVEADRLAELTVNSLREKEKFKNFAPKQPESIGNQPNMNPVPEVVPALPQQQQLPVPTLSQPHALPVIAESAPVNIVPAEPTQPLDLSKLYYDHKGVFDPRRLCIIIPFRDSSSQTSQGANRTANLMQLVPYLTEHLVKAGKIPLQDFEIIVIEQAEGYIFNKGALFNVGYNISRSVCGYMVLHDVDQLPLSATNKYNPPDIRPLHMCTASSQFNFQPAYGAMVGGALAITMEQFEKINGYSNYYWGWGQEDDDLFFRISRVYHDVDRLSSEEGRYQALSHPRVKDLDVTPRFNKGRERLLATQANEFDINKDGLNTVKFAILSVERPLAGQYQVAKKVTVQFKFDKMPTKLDEL